MGHEGQENKSEAEDEVASVPIVHKLASSTLHAIIAQVLVMKDSTNTLQSITLIVSAFLWEHTKAKVQFFYSHRKASFLSYIPCHFH